MILTTRYLRLLDPYMEGPDVEGLQQRLVQLGYYAGPVDGIYNEAVFEAVQSFQTEYGLTPDGIVGPDTWNAIGLDPNQDVPPPSDGYTIEVDVGQKILTLSRFTEILEIYPVAVGKPATPTPLGEWRIIQKTLNPGGAFGTRWMRLNVPWGGYGIHGTNNPASIGTAVSNGCIRMYNESVEELYARVSLGTPVSITGNVFTGRILREGVEPGPDIYSVKANLATLGYYQGEVDGVFDPELTQAVSRFQQDFNIIADGVVGSETYNQLQLAIDQYNDSREP